MDWIDLIGESINAVHLNIVFLSNVVREQYLRQIQTSKIMETKKNLSDFEYENIFALYHSVVSVSVHS